MLGPACLPPSRLRVLALCLILPALLAHCGSFKPQSRKARNDAAAVKGSPTEQTEETTTEENGESETSSENKDTAPEEEAEANENQRVIAVDQTPFFRWLRSGLRSNAKPTRFLNKGDLVELLKENDEKKFSQIRLADRKKGWVPTRLLKETEPSNDSEPPAAPVSSATEEPSEQTESPIPDALSPVGPAQLPTDPDQAQPSLTSDELGEPSFPGLNIIQPKRQPKVETPKPAETKPKPASTEVPPPTTPEIPQTN